MIIKLCLMVCLCMPFICNGDINLKVEGLDSELDYNVRKKLSDININAVKYVDLDLKKKINSAIKAGLRPLGYYSPKVFFFHLNL